MSSEISNELFLDHPTYSQKKQDNHMVPALKKESEE